MVAPFVFLLGFNLKHSNSEDPRQTGSGSTALQGPAGPMEKHHTLEMRYRFGNDPTRGPRDVADHEPLWRNRKNKAKPENLYYKKTSKSIGL